MAQRVWKTYDDVDLDSGYFPELGDEFDRAKAVRIARVGSATARLFPIRQAVDFAVQWIDGETFSSSVVST